MNLTREHIIGMIILILILLILAIAEWRRNRSIDRLKRFKYPLTPGQCLDNLEPATEKELIQDDLYEAHACITSALFRVQHSDHDQRVKHEIYLKEIQSNIYYLIGEYQGPHPIEEYPTYTQHKQNQ